MFSAIDLLRRNHLDLPAAEIAKITSLQAVREKSQINTHVYTGCHRCSKSITNKQPGTGYWYCERCQRLLDGCVICRTTVKGNWVMCQVRVVNSKKIFQFHMYESNTEGQNRLAHMVGMITVFDRGFLMRRWKFVRLSLVDMSVYHLFGDSGSDVYETIQHECFETISFEYGD